MNQLVSLSFLDLMHEQKKSYLEIFKPIILSQINEDGMYLNQLYQKLNETGVLNIQYKTLEYFINNMQDLINKIPYKGTDIYIEFNKKLNITNIIQDREQISQKLNNDLKILFDDFINYYKDKTGKEITFEEAEKYITDFIQNNVYNILSNNIGNKVFSSNENLTVFNYILLISKNGEYKTIYSTFEKIMRGTIIAKEINNKESFNYKNIFKSLLYIVLDSNFIINLLGYGNKITVDATKELFNELKNIKNIHFICYNDTYDEIYNKIKNYEKYKSNRNIHVDDGMYGYFAKNNFRSVEIEGILTELKTLISRQGIVHKELSTNEKNKYENFSKEHDLYNNIRKRKEEKNIEIYTNEKSIEHDTFLISVIASNCAKRATNIEENKYILLTSDISLAKNNKKISNMLNCNNLIISDMHLAVKIFIHNSSKSSSLTIKQILKYHANSLIPDSAIWDKLINIIEQLLKDENLSQNTIRDEVYSKFKEKLCFDSTLHTTLNNKEHTDETLKKLIHNILLDDSDTEYIKNKQLTKQNDALKQINIELEQEKQSISILHDEQKKLNDELENRNKQKKQTIYEKELEIKNINKEKDMLENTARQEHNKLISENKKLKKIIYYLLFGSIFTICIIITIFIFLIK